MALPEFGLALNNPYVIGGIIVVLVIIGVIYWLWKEKKLPF